MIRALLIDDNKIIREYFQKLVDWKKTGFTLVDIASNGLMGWEMFEKYSPDVVITDVQMPGMTGIELTRKIRSVSPETMIVFISSYEDFNFVKAALDLDVKEYILKHEMSGERIYEKLESIQKKYEENFYIEKKHAEGDLLLALSSSEIDEKYLKSKKRYTLCLIEQKIYLPVLSKLTGKYVPEANENVVKKCLYLSSTSVLAVVRVEKYKFAVLLKPNASFKNLIDSLRDDVNELFFALPICVNKTMSECIKNYKRLFNCFEDKYFSATPCVLKYTKGSRCKTSVDTYVSNILAAVEKNDIPPVCELIDKAFFDITEARDFDSLSDITERLFMYLISKHGNNINDEEVFMSYISDDDHFWFESNSIKYWLKNKFVQLLIAKSEKGKYPEAVQKAIDYIQKNYSKYELTVNDIADNVGLSVNRINSLMKEHTGDTTLKWITKTRIDKAKQLLDEHHKMSEICESVGYSSISYFSRVFKKMCGVSPADYRRENSEK